MSSTPLTAPSSAPAESRKPAGRPVVQPAAPGETTEESQLITWVRESPDEGLVLRAIRELAHRATPAAVDELIRVLRHDPHPRRQRTAARMLVRGGFAAAASGLVRVLVPPAPIELRLAIAQEIVAGEQFEMFRPLRRDLAGALLLADDPALRTNLALTFSRLGSIQERFDCLFAAMRGMPTVTRNGMDRAALATALSTQDQKDSDVLLESLVRSAVDERDARTTGLLAATLIAATGDIDAGGAALNEVSTRLKVPPATLEPLRIELGGRQALLPILRLVESDLERYFQRPLHKLRQTTEQNWQQTMQAAQRAFAARLLMSVTVFAFGLLAAGVALWGLATGSSNTDRLLGSGISFVGGLGTMLLVVYTGPLKDIKASVSDLGAANAAFIAYVHRVSEISHTFSARYMAHDLSYEDLKTSSALLAEASKDAIAELGRQ